MDTDTATVRQVRAFNRFYTRVIGVLDAGLAGTPHTLTEARVLFELADAGPDGVATGELRTGLGLDGGYLSRILGRFTDRGLVERERAAADGRRQLVRLTDAGREVFRILDENQSATVGELVEPLDGLARDRLVRAMHDVRRELGGPSAPPSVALRAPAPGDLGWVVSRHGELYGTEYGWDRTFEALAARIVADFVEGDPVRSAMWVAEVDGERAGSVFCVPGPDADTAVLRLLLVEPRFRGLRIGSRLVDECIRFAARTGHRRVTLWTNDVLTSARHVYERAGFRLIDENRHHSFGADLVGQHWSLDLRPAPRPPGDPENAH